MAPRPLCLARLTIALLVLWGSGARAAPPLTIEFLAVGQGDAALITSPTGKTILIDGGPRDAGPILVARLRTQAGHPLDLVLLTHRHADHLGGLAEVVRSVGARMYMDAPFPHPTPAYTALMGALAARAIPVRSAQRGRRIDLGGGAWLTLLSPPEPTLTGHART